MELHAAQRITTREATEMSNTSIANQLRDMRLSAMAREFEAQSQDPATYSQISFEKRFGLIVNAGWNSQQASRQVNYADASMMHILTFLLPAWRRLNTLRTEYSTARS